MGAKSTGRSPPGPNAPTSGLGPGARLGAVPRSSLGCGSQCSVTLLRLTRRHRERQLERRLPLDLVLGRPA